MDAQKAITQNIVALRPKHPTKKPIIIGKFFQELEIELKNISKLNDSILITGETGTGKSLLAKMVHYHSSRKAYKFHTINCSCISSSLFESEIFGHEKGSFTGADKKRNGVVVSTNGGTLFLDEIGDLPLNQQPKILRLIEEKKIQPVGSDIVIDVDVRIICATNKNLQEEITKGTFREDLYYRIFGFNYSIPPLKERTCDISLLIDYFINEMIEQSLIKKDLPDQEIKKIKLIFEHMTWPGNVRQLRSKLRRKIMNLKF